MSLSIKVDFRCALSKIGLNTMFSWSMFIKTRKEYRSSHQRCSIKNMFLKILQNLQENTCARVSFLIKFQDVLCMFSFRLVNRGLQAFQKVKSTESKSCIWTILTQYLLKIKNTHFCNSMLLSIFNCHYPWASPILIIPFQSLFTFVIYLR